MACRAAVSRLTACQTSVQIAGLMHAALGWQREVQEGCRSSGIIISAMMRNMCIRPVRFHALSRQVSMTCLEASRRYHDAVERNHKTRHLNPLAIRLPPGCSS